MSSDRERLRLLDIVNNIEAIDAYLGDMDARAFAADAKTVDAIERCMQRISEAVIRIGEARMKEVAPALPFHADRGLGNLLRHEYDRIDLQLLFTTVKDRLPELRTACARALEMG
jgi:uncharacterized protein with HEPN domain